MLRIVMGLLILSISGCKPASQESLDALVPRNITTSVDLTDNCVADTVIKYVTDTVIVDINSTTIKSCGDDSKHFSQKCTSDISRKILQHCASQGLDWVGHESEDDGRTTSLFCDAFNKANTIHKATPL